MEPDYLFSGSALVAVDTQGRLFLPGFVRHRVDRCCDSQRVLIGPHEIYPCLSGYGRAYGPMLIQELERKRLREEAAGAGPEGHHRRAHRMFGAQEEAGYSSSGRMALPPIIRRRARIDRHALFIGAGATFEIWNPHLALEMGDEDLREIASFRLDQSSPGEGPK